MYFRKIHFVLLLLFSLALFSGCATVPTGQVETPRDGKTQTVKKQEPIHLAALRHSRFANVDHWTIDGRLGIRQGEEGFSAGMKWVQNKKDFDIALLDPLGRKVAQLSGDQKKVILRTVDGKRFEAENAEELLQAQLGWSFPVQSLLFWVKGTPDPKLIVWRQEYDDVGRLVKLHQGHWRLRITKYQNLEKEYIPKLIRMEGRNIKVKLLIRDWE